MAQSMAFNVAIGLLVVAVPAMAQGQKPAAAVAPAVPATVRAGVDLWRAGNYPGAVAIWQPFANAGDPDAMFNLGQAYKLGRAVAMDKTIARDWYRRAATKGHMPAQANLGILLFQAGDKPEAARWLKAAADRGEMRAQYVLGVAHWNGDGVARSLPLAFAYLTRASAQGLAEATGALGNLTRTISPAERASGQLVAASLAAGSGVPVVFAASSGSTSTAELNRMNADAVQKPAPAAPVPVPVVTRPVIAAPTPVVIASATTAAPVPAPAPAQKSAPLPVPKPAVPQVVTVVPPVAGRPQPAATDRPDAPVVRSVDLPSPTPVAAAPVVIKAVVPKPVPVAAKATDKPKLAEKPKIETPSGWRVQLGAFGKRAQAETSWAELLAKQKAAVGKAKPIYEPGTSIVKLQMGPFKTRELAKDACAKIAFGGRACFVTQG